MPISTILSLGKIVVKSRPTPGIPQRKDEEILIIGNGPSAKEFLETTKNQTLNPAVLCVNKFAFGPYFQTLKPKYYLMLDGDFFHFNEAIFQDPQQHPRVKIKPEFAEWQHQINETWKNLFTQNWGLILFIPTAYKNSFMAKKARENGIKTVAITAFSGGAMKEMAEEGIHVPTGPREYGPAEDAHMILDHLLGNYLLRLINGV